MAKFVKGQLVRFLKDHYNIGFLGEVGTYYENYDFKDWGDHAAVQIPLKFCTPENIRSGYVHNCRRSRGTPVFPDNIGVWISENELEPVSIEVEFPKNPEFSKLFI